VGIGSINDPIALAALVIGIGIIMLVALNI
jgi:hypothetical protein